MRLVPRDRLCRRQGRARPDPHRPDSRDRDLLEAILFPSASFVRSYEPVVVRTTGGNVLTGVQRGDEGDEVVVADIAGKRKRACPVALLPTCNLAPCRSCPPALARYSRHGSWRTCWHFSLALRRPAYPVCRAAVFRLTTNQTSGASLASNPQSCRRSGRICVTDLRGLGNRPGFSLLAILTLALGIGASTTIFSVIQNVLLDPFPYTDAARVAAIQIHDLSSSRPGGRTFFQVPEFLDYQEQNHVFEEVIGGTQEDVLQTTSEGTEQVTGGARDAEHVPLSRRAGRCSAADSSPKTRKPDAPPVFVMSHKMWVRQFNQDPSVLGRTFVLNGVPTTLVGIMPQRFTKLGADLWRAVTLDRADPQRSRQFFMFQARLKPGVTLEQAAADVDVIAHRLAKIYPTNYPKQFTVKVVSWVDSLVGQFRTTLYTLAAAVGSAAADRVQQRGEHAARARHGAREGDGDPRVARRRAGGGWSGSC